MSVSTQEERGFRFQAVSASVPRARHLVADWARAEGAPEGSVEAASLAVTEAAANVVRHAYPRSAGEFELRLTRTQGALIVTMRDWGTGLAGALPPTAGAGLGLVLMREMSDDFLLSEPETGGTLACMRFRLP